MMNNKTRSARRRAHKRAAAARRPEVTQDAVARQLNARLNALPDGQPDTEWWLSVAAVLLLWQRECRRRASRLDGSGVWDAATRASQESFIEILFRENGDQATTTARSHDAQPTQAPLPAWRQKELVLFKEEVREMCRAAFAGHMLGCRRTLGTLRSRWPRYHVRKGAVRLEQPLVEVPHVGP